jgi:hypothetical protein
MLKPKNNGLFGSVQGIQEKNNPILWRYSFDTNEYVLQLDMFVEVIGMLRNIFVDGK